MGAADERPDGAVRLAERHTLADEVLGEVGGSEVGLVGGDLHAGGVEGERRDHAPERPGGELAGVERVEERRLVLLEVAVVGEGQALERRKEAGEVADEPSRLASHELGDVGVLLLRQHRRAGGVLVGELREPELVGAPQDELLPQSGEVHHRERADEEGLGDEVAVGDRVERVLEACGEAELVGRGVRVERQARAGEGTGAQRRDGGAGERVVAAVDVAGERPHVGEQVMGQQHGLRPLEVGVAGEIGVAGGAGPVEQGALQRVQVAGEGAALAADVEAQVGRDLVVAAAAGVELGARRSGELRDAAFDGGVDVLVGRLEVEGLVGELGLDGVERGEDAVGVVDAEDAGGAEHADVGA